MKKQYEIYTTTEKDPLAQFLHDIRSPLASMEYSLKRVSTNSTHAPQSKEQNESAQQSEMLKLGLNRVRELILSLQSQQNTPKPVTVFQAVENILAEKEYRKEFMPSLDVEFVYSKDAIQAKALMVDSEFKRVLSIILDNAIESLDKKSKQVLVCLFHVGDQIEISIRDNGCGIPPQYISKLGQHGFTKGKANGNGIGLSYAFQKIREWGGRIEVESELGLGTEFRILVPKILAR